MDVFVWNDRVDRPKAKTLSFFRGGKPAEKTNKSVPVKHMPRFGAVLARAPCQCSAVCVRESSVETTP